jgi:hypothetical protein
MKINNSLTGLHPAEGQRSRTSRIFAKKTSLSWGPLFFGATVLFSMQTPTHADATFKINTAVPMSVSGGDDIQQLKHLISGVGWEFSATAETDVRLKKLNMKSLRCINIDVLKGDFGGDKKFTISDTAALDVQLKACRDIGANPHVVVAVRLPEQLLFKPVTKDQEAPGQMGLVTEEVLGPTDWELFRNYYEAYFEYVLITKKFPNARFEVGNEPDSGSAIQAKAPRPPAGSAASYAAYLELYKNVAQAAEAFEAKHPGVKVTLGGPAITPFTYRFGDFHWGDRFIRDCGLGKIKLDFISLHYYGNLSSLRGEYAAPYPSFTTQLKSFQSARDVYMPGVPIWVTEWGPSYHTNNTLESSINANYIGAAWSADFVDAMLENKVDGALFLVTTDLAAWNKEGGIDQIWGWPSLFTSTITTKGVYPKALHHVFEIVNRLKGKRSAVTLTGSKSIKGIAVADSSTRKVQLMLWNYASEISEFKPAVEKARDEKVTLQLGDGQRFFGTANVQAQRWLVSKEHSDAHSQFQREKKLDNRVELQRVDSKFFALTDKAKLIQFSMPPSSVALIELTPKAK